MKVNDLKRIQQLAGLDSNNINEARRPAKSRTSRASKSAQAIVDRAAKLQAAAEEANVDNKGTGRIKSKSADNFAGGQSLAYRFRDKKPNRGYSYAVGDAHKWEKSYYKIAPNLQIAVNNYKKIKGEQRIIDYYIPGRFDGVVYLKVIDGDVPLEAMLPVHKPDTDDQDLGQLTRDELEKIRHDGIKGYRLAKNTADNKTMTYPFK